MPEQAPASAIGYYAHVTGIAINPDKNTTKVTMEVNVLSTKEDELMRLLKAHKTTLRCLVWEHEPQESLPGMGKGARGKRGKSDEDE